MQYAPAYYAALEQTLDFEGGFSNNPNDAGGRTYRGVTQSTYDAWRKLKGYGRQPVDLITDVELTALYNEEYWQPIAGDQLPAELAACVFDMAVNCGTWNAKLTLQEALRVKGDGVIGPATVGAAKDEPDAVLKFLRRRVAYYQALVRARPGQVEFLGGWMNRVVTLAWKYGHG